MADIDKLLEYLQGQNQRLDDLLRRHVELNTTILSEGFAARIKALEEELEASEDRATKVIDKINNSIPSIANLNIDFKDIDKLKDDLEKLQELIDNANSDDEKEELVDAYEKIASAASDYYRIANEGQEELNKRQLEGIHILDDVEEDLEQRTRAFTKGLNEIKSGIKQIGEGAWNMIEPWRNANHEAMAYGKSVGMSQKTADAYLSRTVSWASRNDIGILFNKTTDELIKLQGKYSEVLGRNVQLTSEQKKDMLAMETFLGEDGAVDMANNLENYGMGMSDAADFIKETIDDAAKSGIHAAKLTKLVRENIKMAQNYTFKDGLRGLESMAKKAAMLKTDMTLVSGLADKVSTVEGAITTGAQLQVLGGSYALGSDPLSLLYESLNDMEGLFDRAVGMAKGKVYYNETTGNFEMGAMDRYMMKQAASSMGVDYTKMTDLAFRQA
jgi:hypothetical protein